MIATEEQLQKIRLKEITEYLIVGLFMGLFSGPVSSLMYAKKWSAYLGIALLVLLHIAFEAYRVDGLVKIDHFLYVGYLAFFLSGYLVVGGIQYVAYVVQRRRT